MKSSRRLPVAGVSVYWCPRWQETELPSSGPSLGRHVGGNPPRKVPQLPCTLCVGQTPLAPPHGPPLARRVLGTRSTSSEWGARGLSQWLSFSSSEAQKEGALPGFPGFCHHPWAATWCWLLSVLQVVHRSRALAQCPVLSSLLKCLRGECLEGYHRKPRFTPADTCVAGRSWLLLYVQLSASERLT